MEAPLQTSSSTTSTPSSPREQRSAELKQTMDEAIERLSQQLAEGHSEGYRAFLSFYSRFWTYSVRNTMLIFQQCPHATRCAGLSLWNKVGYQVRRGEKAIWIWAPVTKRESDPDTGEIVTVVAGFVPAPVFDFSQLEGAESKPLPSPYPVLPDDASDAYALCVAKIRDMGIAVEEATFPDNRMVGYSQPGKIVVDRRLDSRNRLFTLIHELVHQTWHHDLRDPSATRQQLEFEAESVSYVLAAVMGLDHPSARDYLLVYQITPEQLKATLAVIQLMVRQVMRLLELPFAVINQPEALVA